jgi:hypothetical protein
MSTKLTTEEFKKVIDKIEDLRNKKSIDLSIDEDLSIAVMNLISLEEHFYFTSKKTGKSEYLNLLNDTRELRKKLLGQLMPSHEGETWCISKHLLAATMRVIEVGTKYLAHEQREEAERMFETAYKIYAMFWALKMNLVDLKELEKIESTNMEVGPDGKPKEWSFEDIINKMVDCCHE